MLPALRQLLGSALPTTKLSRKLILKNNKKFKGKVMLHTLFLSRKSNAKIQHSLVSLEHG
jgi:hypothetical protein